MKFEDMLTTNVSIEDILDRFSIENRYNPDQEVYYVVWDKKYNLYLMEQDINPKKYSGAYYKITSINYCLRDLRDYLLRGE